VVVRKASFESHVPDFSSPCRVHLIAAGGAAMSAVATILLAMGHRVSGSDQVRSDVTDRIAALGATIWIGHDAAHVADADVVVVSAAIGVDNVELQEAQRRGLIIATRADAMEALGRLRRTVAISGTHGKTTTSAMSALVLEACGLDPSFIVGGTVRALGTGARWTDSTWLSVEADESDGSHLRFRAEVAVVTNVEPDHLDYWGDEATLHDGFVEFLDQAATARIVCADDPGAMKVAEAFSQRSASERVWTYGTAADADYRIGNLAINGLQSSFDVIFDGAMLCRVALGVPGAHNAANATSVLAVAHRLGLPLEAAVAALGNFGGVGRRFERRGEAAGVTFVDDYAHLPTEVAAVVSAAAAGGWGRVVAVFQPHRYTRIRDVGADFATSFDGADVIVITGLYAAGQQPIEGISHHTVIDAIRAARPRAVVYEAQSRQDQRELLTSLLQPGDLCLTMNAGDLTTLPDDLICDLADREREAGR
jgi:UDP-N-acetylmuramate--alanine ligase